MSSPPVGYGTLLRRNGSFRLLWFGQIVSQFGDWFDNIALYTLVSSLTGGSGTALGALLLAEFLPPTLVSPFAGILLDRMPRRLIMIVSDVLRGLLVLLVLLVRDPGDLWLVYLVVVLKVSFVGIFEPARAALLPNVVSRDELVAANALSGLTWSAVLAFGAALGGVVAGTLGFRAAILIDAITFGISALLIARIRVRETHHTEAARAASGPPRPFAGLHELAEGLRFIAGRRDIFVLTLAKAFWNLSGGVLVLYTLYGQQIFPLGREGALSIGLFYAARGVGAGIGPILARQFGGETITAMRRAVGLAYFLSTIGYLWFSGTSLFGLALLAVMLAHMGGSINWVFSTALLQIQVPDRLRGRVFAVEFAALMCTTALSTFLTGAAHDAGWTPRALAVVLALIFLLPGALLTVLLWSSARQATDDADSQ
jgi:MFS family permease